MSIQYEDIDPKNGKYEELFYNIFTKQLGGKYIKTGNDEVILPYDYLKVANAVENMEIYDDDVWLVSPARTGSTWAREMVWCISNDMDLERAKRIQHIERFPFLEGFLWIAISNVKSETAENIFPAALSNSVDRSINQPSPRFIKTHLQWSMLPKQIRNGEKKPKMIYVARNAKDTCVSYFHMHCFVYGYEAFTFDTFCNLFMNDMLFFLPFWSHVLEFWNRRKDENILFIKYEDMRKDLPTVIKKVAAFLKKDLSESQLASLMDHLSFESMRNNPAVNYEEFVRKIKRANNIKHTGHFIRSGQVGKWKQEMSKQMAEKFDEWTKKNLKNTGLILDEC